MNLICGNHFKHSSVWIWVCCDVTLSSGVWSLTFQRK